MEVIIKVSDEYKRDAITFLKTVCDVTKEDVKKAKQIRSLIIGEITKQFDEYGKIYAEEKYNIETSELSDIAKEHRIQKLNYDYTENVTRDPYADYLVNQLSKFIISNSTCDVCDDCASLIGVYLKYDEKYNQSTVEEINNTRQRLCDASKGCKKAHCCAMELINIIDTDPIINRNKGK